MKRRACTVLLTLLLLALTANAGARVQLPPCALDHDDAVEGHAQSDAGSAVAGAGHADGHTHAQAHSNDDDCPYHGSDPTRAGKEPATGHTDPHAAGATDSHHDDGHCGASCALACAVASGSTVLPGAGALVAVVAPSMTAPSVDSTLAHGLRAPPFRPPRPAPR